MDAEAELSGFQSDEVESAGSDDEINQRKHSKLLSAMKDLDSGFKRPKIEQRTEPTLEVSEFNLSTSSDKGVKLYQLLGSLKNTSANSQLKRQLVRVRKGTKQLDVPLHKHEAEKIQRKIAYNKTSKDISKWDDVVKTNRRAEHISFPLDSPRIGLETTEKFVKKFKPSTPLEQEVYKLLNGNKYAERMGKELTKAEEEVLSAMSLEEAQARRSELQKSRALMSYFESKCKRQKKIKSKKYRRVQRKSKAKEESKRLEELMRSNPDEAEAQLERMERTRAQERVTLRHRNMGKWAQQASRFAKYNEETKHKLSDQLQRSRELTEKFAKALKSDEEDDVPVQQVKPTLSLRDINNPWLGGEEKSAESSKEIAQVSEGEKYSLPGAVFADNDPQRDEDEEGEEEEQDELEVELKRIKQKREVQRSLDSRNADLTIEIKKLPKKNKRKNITDLKKKGEASEVELTGNSGEEDAADDNVGEDVGKTDVNEDGSKTEDIHEDNREDGEDSDESNDDDIVTEFIADVKKLRSVDENIEKTKDVSQESLISEDLTRRASLKSLEGNWSNDNDEGNKSSPKVKDHKPARNNTNSKDVFTLEPTRVMTLAPTVAVDEEDGKEHLMNIQEAFADDDVIEEFTNEKEAKIEKDNPKSVDITLPGWGDWAGTGVKISKKKKKRFIIPAKPAPPRKDSNLHHVIINEDRDKKLAAHQVSHLPFPFASAEQFEKSIRAPIGSTWNTPSSVQKLTMPKVSTKMGTIIEPIHEDEAFKKRVKGSKRRGPDTDIALDAEAPTHKKKKNFKGMKKNK